MSRTLIFLRLLITSPIMAGSADALIRGKTESGRTELEIRVGDIDGLISSVKLTINGESYSITNAESLSQSVVRDRKNHVYFVILDAGARQFRLWMIPHSEKILQQGSGAYRSRFAAVLEATGPRKANHGTLTPRITLDWEDLTPGKQALDKARLFQVK